MEILRLEAWREKALAGIGVSLKERNRDPVKTEPDTAIKRIGELTMENELLRLKTEKSAPSSERESR